ncbi:MAG: YlxR family protein [Coriobacteriia bacterium]|nr:YlxR family protein [Coriobacteriia bacterium]
MPKARKTPTRTCVGCREPDDKRELVRFVRTPEGDVELDPTGKANGRGAYVCARMECFEAAVRRGRLASALRVNLTEEDVDRLRRDLEALLGGGLDARTVTRCPR